jgi:hypothetical protein
VCLLQISVRVRVKYNSHVRLYPIHGVHVHVKQELKKYRLSENQTGGP